MIRGFRRLCFDVKWLKEYRTRGRTEREVEFREERMRERHREEHEHKDKVTGNQIFVQNILCFPLQFVSFIEKRKIGRLRRRDVSGDRSSCGGYASSSWTVFCLLLLPILARW